MDVEILRTNDVRQPIPYYSVIMEGRVIMKAVGRKGLIECVGMANQFSMHPDRVDRILKDLMEVKI